MNNAIVEYRHADDGGHGYVMLSHVIRLSGYISTYSGAEMAQIHLDNGEVIRTVETLQQFAETIGKATGWTK